MDIPNVKSYNGLILPGDPIAEKHASGHILMDGVQTADTLQCAHCNGHFISCKGSGITRGFCLKCNGVICGPRCAGCYSFEKKIDDYEKGKLAVLS